MWTDCSNFDTVPRGQSASELRRRAGKTMFTIATNLLPFAGLDSPIHVGLLPRSSRALLGVSLPTRR
jgi:hypothetical protein